MGWKAVVLRGSACVAIAAAVLTSVASTASAQAPSGQTSPAQTSPAQTWPTQTIRLIVPFPAGGSNDVMGRLIAPHLEKALGQTVIVDNRPAAAGQVGSEAVARAAPDGHTLLMVASSHTVQPALNPKLPYNTEKDFAPVTLISTGGMFFFVHPGVPANTLTEFVALAKKEPGKYNYASPGVGSQTQLTIELLSHRTGIKLQHIPYRGGAPAVQAMLSGETHFTMLAPNVIFPHIEAGKIRAVATGDRKRHPRVPNLATTEEQGFKGLEAIQWVGVLTTAGTPKPVIQRLNKEINRIIQLPDVVAVLAKQGVSPTGGTPDEFQALISREIKQWRDVAREANIKRTN
ncbi:MAG: tripartite tricarboxylate transporter substrate binding protein [Rhizobiales bacterium]|nr:tripartite tricarboxylate transporter substrate binding protein [Hyphomicrobiales bacterium]